MLHWQVPIEEIKQLCDEMLCVSWFYLDFTSVLLNGFIEAERLSQRTRDFVFRKDSERQSSIWICAPKKSHASRRHNDCSHTWLRYCDVITCLNDFINAAFYDTPPLSRTLDYAMNYTSLAASRCSCCIIIWSVRVVCVQQGVNS